MLDQPVPNPVAKNPNFNTTKVFAAIGIILIVIIIISGGIWYLVQSAQDKAGTIEENTVTKTATSSAKTATTSATTGWKTYTNKTVGYEVKYPTGWFSSSSSEEKNCGVRFGVSSDQLGYCAAGNGGLIQFGLVTIVVIKDTVATEVEHYFSGSAGDLVETETVVGARKAVKISGTQSDKNEIYLLDLAGNTLSIQYYQGAQVTTDYSSEFEQIVSTFKFL